MRDEHAAQVFECEGWWEQDLFGRQPMEKLRISFDAKRIQGAGIDIIGPFSLTGAIEENGAVAIVKRYLGQHSVDYLGTYDGEGSLTGEWRIGLDRGRWLITIRRAVAGAATPILEYEPPQ